MTFEDFTKFGFLLLASAPLTTGLAYYMVKKFYDLQLKKIEMSYQTRFTNEADLFKSELNSKVNMKLEEFKKELEIRYIDISHRRHIYEEFSSAIEEILLGNSLENYALKINKLLGLLAIYAPDEIYNNIKEILPAGKFVGSDQVKSILYSSLRKDIFGENTKIESKDIAKHLTVINPQ